MGSECNTVIKLGICDIIELLKQHNVDGCTFYINGFMVEVTDLKENEEEN